MILSKILKLSKKQSKTSDLYIGKLSKFLMLLSKSGSAKMTNELIKKEELTSTYKKFGFGEAPSAINSNQVSSSLVSYIINVSLSQTNTIVSVTDVKGNPKISISAGLVNLAKRQKKKQPMALISIFKVLLLKARFLKNKPVALHFKNTKVYYESLLIKALKDKLFIKSIQSYNLSPHNGCRPKKLKRVKRRTKRMVLR